MLRESHFEEREGKRQGEVAGSTAAAAHLKREAQR